jgi:hypothetical protein
MFQGHLLEVDWKHVLDMLKSYWFKKTGCELSNENDECLAVYFGNKKGKYNTLYSIFLVLSHMFGYVEQKLLGRW